MKSGGKTALRRALLAESSLHDSICSGLNAIKASHRDYFDLPIRSAFADSIDLDEATRVGREQENRWDYLLSHAPSSEVVAVEPHSAKQDEISTVVKKLAAAREQLKAHLRAGAKVSRWLWVASGEVQFANTEKTVFQLAQNGILFVGRTIRAKHLGTSGPIARQTRTRRRTRKR